MDSSSENSIDVTLAAIDGGYLVLESTDDKTRFQWPLHKIPRPLEIGSRLTLELQNSRELATTADSIPSRGENRNNKDKDSSRRKLLEDLVN
jgi:hypothetical protein